MSERFPGLLEERLDPEPLRQFEQWFEAASAAMPLAEAAALATANRQAEPSLRMVLVKGWDSGGFVFYSNHESRKGQELETNPAAALLFYWPVLGRQVRLEGRVERLAPIDSDRYFATRPRASQIGAAVSAQSRPIAGRAELDRGVAEFEAKLGEGPVPRPAWWGGYRLQPTSYEFWQQQEGRLHDRVRYRADAQGWRMERLQP
ncbi:MAG TPA: pyridoxamine 5'-phosphate oxidase [Candidatus Dormibacteraeota bacterium]